MFTEEILTVPDVAGLLKVVDKTIYTMARRGELPAFKVRGQWRFRKHDLEAWIDHGVELRATVATRRRLRAERRAREEV